MRAYKVLLFIILFLIIFLSKIFGQVNEVKLYEAKDGRILKTAKEQIIYDYCLTHRFIVGSMEYDSVWVNTFIIYNYSEHYFNIPLYQFIFDNKDKLREMLNKIDSVKVEKINYISR